MKFNISNSSTGQQKTIDVDDEKRVRVFYDRKMGEEVDGHYLGEEFNGYVFKIKGGNDKQGFPMKNGVFANHRVRVLLKPGNKCFRPRRDGERKRKSVRGCVVGPDLAVISLAIVKKGDKELVGITDEEKPRRRGPKRAGNIRKVFGLHRDDDVRKYVVKREVVKGDKTYVKRPKIQRLITDVRLRRKRLLKKYKKDRFEASKTARTTYEKLLSTYIKEQKDKRAGEKKKVEESKKVDAKAATPAPAAQDATAAPAQPKPKASKGKKAAKTEAEKQ
jgi:small subunit ribosomal protein S6e